MQTMLKISIIIPIYKVESYIERCNTSVLRQTYRNLEVILVDDYTPDSSMEIAKAVINENQNCGMNFVFLKHDHNFGLSAARNTGINAATGDYLFFLDSDDELPNLAIENLYAEVVNKYADQEKVIRKHQLSRKN
jgi:glycosyltransferase involved in cell wall biosynthesis